MIGSIEDSIGFMRHYSQNRLNRGLSHVRASVFSNLLKHRHQTQLMERGGPPVIFKLWYSLNFNSLTTGCLQASISILWLLMASPPNVCVINRKGRAPGHLHSLMSDSLATGHLQASIEVLWLLIASPLVVFKHRFLITSPPVIFKHQSIFSDFW